MDHPANGSSSFGVIFFGHFENLFKRIQKAKGSSKISNIPVFLSTSTSLASSLDDASKGASSSVMSKDIGVRAIHTGLSVDIINNFGMMNEIGDMLHLWSNLKPHLHPKYAKQIAENKDEFYVASEATAQWQLMKTRAMRREGIDGNWNAQPERPAVAPRQFFKANGETLSGLINPYPSQGNPVIQLHVMASMFYNNTENVSLMPSNETEIINPHNAEQSLEFNEGIFTLVYDNSNSTESYEYYTKGDTVGHWLRHVNMSSCRGIAITVNVTEKCDGTVLVFSTSGFPRMYAVDIDFVGEKTIEIPNGEVVNNREGWDIFKAGTIPQFDYANQVNAFRLFLHKVPAGKKVNMQITNVEAIKENKDTGLINPEFTLNNDTVTVNGVIPYDHYLVYSENAVVYDANWNYMESLSDSLTLSGDNLTLTAVNGSNSFSVKAVESSNVWLSCRIKVEDIANPIVIPKT